MRRVTAGIALLVGFLMLVPGIWGMRGLPRLIMEFLYGSSYRWVNALPETELLETGFSLIWTIVFWRVFKAGRAYFNHSRQVGLNALKMLRADGRIDTLQLVATTGCRDEIDVREHIAEQQRRGVLPREADLFVTQRGTAQHASSGQQPPLSTNGEVRARTLCSGCA